MRVRGRVKSFDQVQGCGVIGREHGEPDCLVRHAAMRGTVYRTLAAGDAVEFEIVPGGASAVARDVVRLAA